MIKAIQKTYEFYFNNAYGIFKEDLYADHVTTGQKLVELQKGVTFALEVLAGEHHHVFTVAQRIHYYKTGDCVKLLP